MSDRVWVAMIGGLGDPGAKEPVRAFGSAEAAEAYRQWVADRRPFDGYVYIAELTLEPAWDTSAYEVAA